MGITDVVFRKKAIFWFLVACLAAAGGLSYRAISKLEDPEIVVMIAKVVTIYPGASAHEVEMQVTNPLEDAISELADIESVASRSASNVSTIDVELKMTVPQGEIPQRWEFLRRKVQQAARQLPQGCMEPLVLDDIGDVYGMFYAMTAPGYTPREMSDQAERVKRELLQVEGVRKVAIYGRRAPVADIVLSPERMARLGVMPLQVVAAVGDYTSAQYAGSALQGGGQARVQVTGRVGSAAGLGAAVVKGLDGELFRLDDLAEIREGYAEPARNRMWLDNSPALGVSLSMEPGGNIVEVGRRVERRLAELQAGMPAGFAFTKVFFQPDVVERAIGDFMVNLVSSVAIVVLVLMLTMGLRGGMIIGAGLLLTILATFPFMYAAGGTMQRISLGAFIVAMGMLVDNAIVVLDGILVNLSVGRRRKSAFTGPARRAAWPLLGATLIAIAAFLPAVLSKDAAGTYVHDLFVVLCISLFVSWVLALTQVPLFAAIFLRGKRGAPASPGAGADPYSSPLHRLLRRWLAFLMRHKAATLLTAAALLAACAASLPKVKKTFFPDFNYNQAYIEYKLPYGVSPDRVADDLAGITRYLRSLPEVRQVVTSQGMTPTRYCLVRPLGDVADNYGELIVDFDDYKTMVRMKPRIAAHIRGNYPDAYFRIRRYNLSVKASHTVEARFSGPDPAVLRDLAAQTRRAMAECPYVDPTTVCDDWHPMGKSLAVEYDMARARRAGASRGDVARAILAATDGLPLGTLYEGETAVAVNLKIRRGDGSRPDNPDDLAALAVWNLVPNADALDMQSAMAVAAGILTADDLKEEIVRPAPLGALTAGLGMAWDEHVVTRVDRKRAIEAQCDPLDGYAPELVRSSIRGRVEAIPLPEGYTLKWVGEHDLQSVAMRNVFSYMPVTAMIIIFLLMLLFNDVRRPAIVLACIPMAMVGIVPGLVATGQPYTFMAIIGTFGLAGMLIKNAIVLLDEIEKRIREGSARYHAVVEATVSRARPVVMASATTILGMLPLVLDPMYCSMAVTVVSGLLVGTLITLVFVPVLYGAFYHVRNH